MRHVECAPYLWQLNTRSPPDIMRTLYHQMLDPSSRAIRIILGEKRLECELIDADTNQDLPVLVEDGAVVTISNTHVITEYLNEAYPEPDLLGYDPLLRVDVRRIGYYFADTVGSAVTHPLLQHKLYGHLQGTAASPHAIASAKIAMRDFLEFIATLDDNNNWLAGPSFSLADVFAASHIATLDYIGAIDWAAHLPVQRWYRRVKSRRSLNSILADRVEGMDPPVQYSDPDF